MRRASDAATAMVVSCQADGEDERANPPTSSWVARAALATVGQK